MSLPAPLQLPPSVDQHRYADANSLAESLATAVATHLRAAITERGVAALRVSGGRSPIAFFAALSKHELDWQRVTIGLVDERWVSHSDDASNARLVREHLLQGQAAAAHFVALSNAEATPELGLAAVQLEQAVLPSPCDVIVLGMGDDGHTASLFPHAPGTAAAMDLDNPAQLALVNPASAPHPRVTLTLSALLQARQLILSIQGAAKRQVVERAVTANAPDLPIVAVLRNERTPLAVYYCD